MGINQAYPSLNEITPSWADIVVSAATNGASLIDMSGIAGIKWSRKVEVGKKRGASGGRVMARTTGQGDQECSVTFYRDDLEDFKRNLMQIAPTRGNQRIIGLVAFDINVQQTPPNSIKIFQTLIKGCRYLGDDDDMKEGTDPDKVELTFDPIEIANFIDGVEVVLL